MKQRMILTIGREYGSGGKEIGQLLGERLGIPCYDKEILLESAKASGLHRALFEENDEKPAYSLLYTLAMGAPIAIAEGQQPLGTMLFLEQFKAIRQLAESGSGIFIGRCADYVLREDADLVSVFVHAPIAQRSKRIAERLAVSPEQAEAILLKKDKRRAKYYQHYTEQRWGDAKNYQLCLDTGTIGIPACVVMIQQYLELL